MGSKWTLYKLGVVGGEFQDARGHAAFIQAARRTHAWRFCHISAQNLVCQALETRPPTAKVLHPHGLSISTWSILRYA